MTDLDAEMRGVGRSSSLTVVVPGALPGERVSVRVDHVDRSQRAYATLLRVLSPSGDRVESPCERFLDCSGCDLLHASSAFALEAKRERVSRALGGIPVDPVVPSPRSFGYRALAKLVVGPGGILGSYRARSHDVADMQGCKVHAPEVERIVEAIRLLRPTKLRYVLVRASLSEGRALVVLVTSTTDESEVRRVASGLSPRDDVAAVYHHVNSSQGDELLNFSSAFKPIFEKGPIHEKIGTLQYELKPGAFSQVNPLAAAELYARAVSLAAPQGAKVLDLYSGSAGLALAMAQAGAREVVSVESIQAATEAGKASARLNKVGNKLRFINEKAEQAPIEDFDIVILNPPRKGSTPEVLNRVMQISPARIVYVSCNPDTLARDLQTLAPNYQINQIIPVDLFPGTGHVETIVRLAPGN